MRFFLLHTLLCYLGTTHTSTLLLHTPAHNCTADADAKTPQRCCIGRLIHTHWFTSRPRVCTHRRAHTHTHAQQPYTHTRTHTHTHTHTDTHTHTQTHKNTHTHAHTERDTHTHARTHTHTQSLLLSQHRSSCPWTWTCDRTTHFRTSIADRTYVRNGGGHPLTGNFIVCPGPQPRGPNRDLRCQMLASDSIDDDRLVGLATCTRRSVKHTQVNTPPET